MLYNHAIEKLGSDEILPLDEILNPEDEDIAPDDGRKA